MYLVIGLGNPGPQYALTRHNVGRLVVDQLARRFHTGLDREHMGAKTAKVRMGTEGVVLARLGCFMNESGGPAQRLASFYKLPTDHVVIVHDDLELPFGEVRVKEGGGHGGHNGLRDLAKHLGAGTLRVRVGISRPPRGHDTAAYVLGRFTDDESRQLDEITHHAADAVEVLVREGFAAATERSRPIKASS